MLAALCAVNIFLLVLGPTTLLKSGSGSSTSYRQLEQELKGTTEEEKDALIVGHYETISNILAIDSVERSIAMGTGGDALLQQNKDIYEKYYDLYKSGEYLKYTSNLYDEYKFVNQIYLEYTEVADYSDYLESIQTQGENINRISVFSEKSAGGTYNEELIQKTIADYDKLFSLQPSYYPQKGLRTAINFQLTDLVALFIILAMASFLVREEVDNRLIFLLRTTPRGRGSLMIRKIIALSVSVLAITLLLYGSNLLICALQYGLGDFSSPIQSYPFLLRSILSVNVWQYLLLFLFTKWFGLFVVSLWVLLACMLTKKAMSGYLLAILFPVASEFLRSNISANSRRYILRYGNIASLLQTNEILGDYRNLCFASHPISLLYAMLMVGLLYAALLLVANVVCFSRYRVRSPRKWLHLPHIQRHKSIKKHRRKPMRLPILEAYKILVTNGGAVVLVLFVVFMVNMAMSTASFLPADEIYYKNMMSAVEGNYTEDTYEWLKEQWQKYLPLIDAKNELANGTIDQEEYARILGENSSLVEEKNTFMRVMDKVRVANQDPTRLLVYDTGHNYYFGLTRNNALVESLVTALAIVLLASPAFAIEKQTRLVRLFNTTPLGKLQTIKNKLRVCLVLVIFLVTVSILPRVYVLLRDYGVHCLTAPLRSLDAYVGAPEGFPIILFIVLVFAIRLIACFVVMILSLYVSQKIGNIIGAVLVSSLLFVLPSLLAFSGLDALKWLSIYPLFDFAALLTSPGTAGFAWLFLVGVCFWGVIGSLLLVDE